METLVHLVNEPQLSAEAEEILGSLEQNTGSRASALLERSIQLLGYHPKDDTRRAR